MTGYTNEFIVNVVAKHYNIRDMILKNISESRLDHSFKDLEQLIMIELIRMDNQKLNYLYIQNVLRFHIVAIIVKQRDGQGGMKYFSQKKQALVTYNTSEYSRSLKLYDNVQPIDVAQEQEHEIMTPKMKFTNKKLAEFCSYRSMTGMTQDQLKLAVGSDLLLYYCRRKLSLTAVARQFKMSRSKAAGLIKAVKDEVRSTYEKEFVEDDYVDDDDYIF